MNQSVEQSRNGSKSDYPFDAKVRMNSTYSRTGRVGIEGGLFGKSVILAPSTYYEKMAFVQVAHSKEAYFNLIEMSLKNTVEQSFEQRCSAYAAYWVAETFGLHKTNFTPIPSDFLSWVDEDPLPYGRRRTLRCF